MDERRISRTDSLIKTLNGEKEEFASTLDDAEGFKEEDTEAIEVGLFTKQWNKWTSKVNILVEDNDKLDSLRK